MLELALRHVDVFMWLGRFDGVAAHSLEALEALVDTAPARAHEIDEKREIVDACVSLGEKVALDPLEPPNRLVQEATDLGDVPCDGENLGTDAVSYGGTHVLRNRHFELGRGDGERLDLSARTLERGLDRSWLGSSGCRFRNSLFRPLEREGVHGREATLSAGWTPRSSSTTSRTS